MNAEKEKKMRLTYDRRFLSEQAFIPEKDNSIGIKLEINGRWKFVELVNLPEKEEDALIKMRYYEDRKAVVENIVATILGISVKEILTLNLFGNPIIEYRKERLLFEVIFPITDLFCVTKEGLKPAVELKFIKRGS